MLTRMYKFCTDVFYQLEVERVAPIGDREPYHTGYLYTATHGRRVVMLLHAYRDSAYSFFFFTLPDGRDVWVHATPQLYGFNQTVVGASEEAVQDFLLGLIGKRL